MFIIKSGFLLILWGNWMWEGRESSIESKLDKSSKGKCLRGLYSKG